MLLEWLLPDIQTAKFVPGAPKDDMVYMDMWHLPHADMSENAYLCTLLTSILFRYLERFHRLINGCALHLLCACVLVLYVVSWLFDPMGCGPLGSYICPTGFPRHKVTGWCHALLQNLLTGIKTCIFCDSSVQAASLPLSHWGKSYIHYTDTPNERNWIFYFKFFCFTKIKGVICKNIRKW